MNKSFPIEQNADIATLNLNNDANNIIAITIKTIWLFLRFILGTFTSQTPV